MPILQPLGDKVVVQPLEDEDRLESGIYIPETAKDKPQRGYVVAVGPGRFDINGKLVAMDVKEEEEVLFAKYAGSTFKFTPDAEESFVLLSQEDIIAKVIYSAEELKQKGE